MQEFPNKNWLLLQVLLYIPKMSCEAAVDFSLSLPAYGHANIQCTALGAMGRGPNWCGYVQDPHARTTPHSQRPTVIIRKDHGNVFGF